MRLSVAHLMVFPTYKPTEDQRSRDLGSFKLHEQIERFHKENSDVFQIFL